MRDLFARFVPENVVDDVLARTDGGLRLGGVAARRHRHVQRPPRLHVFAEALPPDRVIDVLNHYLSEMSDTILDHGGTLVAYMGDGIMAVFGAPIEQDDHADRALARRARDALGAPAARSTSGSARRAWASGFRMGIGLNSGQRDVRERGIGAAPRVHGDRRHDEHGLAHRGDDEGHAAPAAPRGRHPQRLKDPVDDLVRVGEFEVRGRTAKVTLWSLPDAPAEAKRRRSRAP